MNESDAMREIRKIRDESSLRHLSMSREEISKEMDQSVAWFLKKMGRSVPMISTERKQTAANRPAA